MAALEPTARQHRGHHDWHSAEYVEGWITGDVTKDGERRPMLREMLELAPFPLDTPIDVVDIGGGYGIVTESVFSVFPLARVTLLDYSAPMIEQAKQRLIAHDDRMRYRLCDLTAANWTETAGGPYDLAVSAICIHNLREAEVIAEVYRGVRKILRPTGAFLDSDYVHTGGLDAHLEWLRQAGFTRTVGERKNDRLAVMAAYAF